jgi:flagellar basal-body rod protein FlgB
MIVGATSQAAGPTGPLYVMALADRRADWAATRQAAIAGNIANADTPSYKARDIEPFEVEAAKTRLQLTVTRPEHMALSPLEMRAEQVSETDAWDVTHSANTVSIDEQLMKSGETERHHRMAVTVLGSFHRMLIDSVSFR